MGIKLQKYQQQTVTPSAFSGKEVSIQAAAQAPLQAASAQQDICLLYTSPSPRDGLLSRMPSSA